MNRGNKSWFGVALAILLAIRKVGVVFAMLCVIYKALANRIVVVVATPLVIKNIRVALVTLPAISRRVVIAMLPVISIVALAILPAIRNLVVALVTLPAISREDVKEIGVALAIILAISRLAFAMLPAIKRVVIAIIPVISRVALVMLPVIRNMVVVFVIKQGINVQHGVI